MFLKQLFCNHNFSKLCVDLKDDYYFDTLGYPQLDKIATINESCSKCNKFRIYTIKVRQSSQMEKIAIVEFYKTFKSYFQE